MTTKYNIGTLNEATLATGNPNLGFTVVNNGTPITIKSCIEAIKGAEANAQVKSKYVALSKDATGTGLDMSGKCYKGVSYNPIVNPDDTTGTLFDIYGMPDGECTTVDNCLKGNSKTILDKELVDITALITANEKEKDDVQIRLLAIEKNLPYASAEQEYKNNIEVKRLTRRKHWKHINSPYLPGMQKHLSYSLTKTDYLPRWTPVSSKNLQN